VLEFPYAKTDSSKYKNRGAPGRFSEFSHRLSTCRDASYQPAFDPAGFADTILECQNLNFNKTTDKIQVRSTVTLITKTSETPEQGAEHRDIPRIFPTVQPAGTPPPGNRATRQVFR
jgi:hypothetical protein